MGSMRMVQSSDDALSGSSSSLPVHSFNNVAGGGTYSASEDCKRILEMEAGEGVKAVVKREKRELNRGINCRYWHVRKVSEKLVHVGLDPLTSTSTTAGDKSRNISRLFFLLGPNNKLIKRFLLHPFDRLSTIVLKSNLYWLIFPRLPPDLHEKI